MGARWMDYYDDVSGYVFYTEEQLGFLNLIRKMERFQVDESRLAKNFLSVRN
jgi:hypothetical protein